MDGQTNEWRITNYIEYHVEMGHVMRVLSGCISSQLDWLFHSGVLFFLFDIHEYNVPFIHPPV